MSRVRLTIAARDDLAGIWEYSVENWARGKARIYMTAIRTACALAASREIPSRAVSGADNLRQVRSGKHLIFFRPDGDGILVLRVLHESMDVPRHLPGD